MTTALLFERAAPASRNFVFGEGYVPPRVDLAITGVFPALTARISFIPPVEIAVTGAFPDLTASVQIIPGAIVTLTGVFPALQAVAEVTYRTNTSRPTVAQLRDTIQAAVPTEGGITQPQQHAQGTNTGSEAPFTEATRHTAGTTSGFENGVRLPLAVVAPSQDGTQARSDLTESMQEGDRQWLRFYSQFQEADRVFARLFGAFEDGVKVQSTGKVHPFQEARKREAKGYTGRATDAAPRPLYRDNRFQDARVAPPGLYVRPVVPEPPTFWWGTDLLFECPPLAGPWLVFGDACTNVPDGPAGLVVVPIKRVYIVINSASLRRVDGNVSIPLLNLSMSLDVDSWTWTASASLPGRALDAVAPNSSGDPVEVEAMINGVAYRFLVESISRDRSFNQSALKIGLRGKTALLDTPYAPIMSFTNSGARTMVQLAEDVLTVNGMPFGWGVNWAQDSWSVPAGVFAHQGSYISALNALAGAAGAYVQPHRTLQEISVLARYPTAPWGWATATPDFELPAAVTTQEGIEWVNRPQYNRVFVSGVSQGVLGQVTRAGTAGDLVAQMVTDALITDALAVRQRGLPILANTGRIANVTLKLPVLAETGIIPPGKMIRYVDGGVSRIGISRSVNVSVGASAVDLRQTIAVETHE